MDKNYVKTFSLFWDAFKWIVGLLLSILLALSYVFLTPFCLNIFIPAAVIFVCVFFRLNIAYIPITDVRARLIWSFFSFGLFGWVSSVFVCHTSEGLTYYSLAILIGCIVFILLYSFIPLFSFYLKYNDVKTNVDFMGDYHRCNGVIGNLVLLTIIFFITVVDDRARKENFYFAKEQFVPVKFITKEIKKGNTFYILEAKGKLFGLTPYEYPEVRNIHPGSKVKVLFGSTFNGLTSVDKIEIKN